MTAAERRWSAGTTLPASLAEAFVARAPALSRASFDTTTFLGVCLATTYLRDEIRRPTVSPADGPGYLVSHQRGRRFFCAITFRGI